MERRFPDSPIRRRQHDEITVAKKAARKSQKAAAATPSLVPQLPGAGALVINPFGETQQRKVLKSKIAVSRFDLSDGTKLLVTPILSDVRRAIKQYNANGEPLYFLTLGSTIVTKAPKKLMRKVK
jgi:hypothetical protein